MTIHQAVLTVIGFFAAVALVVIVALAPNYVHAATVKPMPKPKPPTCGTMEEMKATLRTVNPPVQFSEIGPYGMKLFLSQFNSIPPVSNIIGDSALIVEVTGSEKIAIVVFKDGCITNQNAISRGELRKILRSV